jgi:hypothetical protein
MQLNGTEPNAIAGMRATWRAGGETAGFGGFALTSFAIFDDVCVFEK